MGCFRFLWYKCIDESIVHFRDVIMMYTYLLQFQPLITLINWKLTPFHLGMFRKAVFAVLNQRRLKGSVVDGGWPQA